MARFSVSFFFSFLITSTTFLQPQHAPLNILLY
jgi:hypothetical protein